ncbi:MAG: hypothetical protein ACRDSZ_13040 [Pseudonocardiaceae bacterium]
MSSPGPFGEAHRNWWRGDIRNLRYSSAVPSRDGLRGLTVYQVCTALLVALVVGDRVSDDTSQPRIVVLIRRCLWQREHSA